jgi:hypothetical protein
MRRIVIGCLALALSTTLFAQKPRTVSPEADKIKLPEVSGNTVSGIVTGVSGNTIQLANGLVAIDASGALITGENGATTISTVTTGALILAVLKPGDVAANAPLPASMITVTRSNQVTITGTVSSVDAANNRFTILGRTIQLNSSTRGTKASDLHSGVIAIVDANNVNGVLVASSVQQLSPQPLPTTIIHGNVKSIGSSTWVVTDRNGADTTIVVNTQTKIVGAPAVGDIVDVVASIDNSHQYVAISISRSVDVGKPPTIIPITFKGVVKSISAHTWTVADDKAPAGATPITLQITESTLIVGSPVVGDHVEVVVQPESAATSNYKALVIRKI